MKNQEKKEKLTTVYEIQNQEAYLTDFKNRLKQEMGIRCPCNDTNCVECLVSKCTEDNCPVHFMRKKLEFRGRDKNE